MSSGARKILVDGPPGSGKTTVARRLAEATGLPHVELDALHWGPGWSEPSADEFRARVAAALPDEGWVVDGNYGKLGDLVLAQADLVVWLDPPLRTILRRLVSRTLRRIRSREELFGGNRESWRQAFFSRHSLFLWAVKTHFPRRRRLSAQLEHRNAVRLRSRGDIESWLTEVGARA